MCTVYSIWYLQSIEIFMNFCFLYMGYLPVIHDNDFNFKAYTIVIFPFYSGRVKYIYLILC